MTELKRLSVEDIEFKIQERMAYLEGKKQVIRIDELKMLLDWILCGDDY